MSLSNLFLKFGTFMVLYLGCVLYLDIPEKKTNRDEGRGPGELRICDFQGYWRNCKWLIYVLNISWLFSSGIAHFTAQMTLHHLLHMPMSKKPTKECKDPLNIFRNVEKDLWKGSLISVSSEPLKNSFFDQHFLYVMVKTFLKIISWQSVVPHAEHLLVSSATLLCRTQNILTLSMLLIFWEVWLMHCLVCSVHLIKVLSVFEHNFFIWKIHCLMLLLNFITSKYSFFRGVI